MTPDSDSWIGPYRVLTPIDSGGMASLYLGFRPPKADLVAIKVVRHGLRADAHVAQMFRDESRNLQRVHHANVVRVLEAGEYPDGRYLAMEYVHGCSLSKLLRELKRRGRALPIPLAVHIVREVAHALQAAHEAVDADGQPMNLVHRDVSPPNIMVSARGQVKLIDFGVSKAIGNEEITGAGVIKGKLPYMSPEQATGATIDRRTDIYALGAVLWELLAHEPAFTIKNVARFLATIREVPKRPSEVNPKAPRSLDRVALIALSLAPEHRFESADHFREELERACPAPNGRMALCALVDELVGLRLQELEASVSVTVSREVERAVMGGRRDDTEVNFETGDNDQPPVTPSIPNQMLVDLLAEATQLAAHRELEAITGERSSLSITFNGLLRRSDEPTGAIPIMSLEEPVAVYSCQSVRADEDTVRTFDFSSSAERHAPPAREMEATPIKPHVLHRRSERNIATLDLSAQSDTGRSSRALFYAGVGMAIIVLFMMVVLLQVR